MQTDLKWEDVMVGDIITVELSYIRYFFLGPHQLTGEVVNIVDTERLNQNDPLVLLYLTSRYLIRIKTNEDEYSIQSNFWNLINIERKDKMETQEQQFRNGDTVLVISNDVKISLGFPKDEELTAEIVNLNTNHNILIHSEQLEKLHLGHDGDKPQQFPKRGCWWVSEKSLQLVKRGSENEFDIFI